jgi:predicted dehydrogenase
MTAAEADGSGAKGAARRPVRIGVVGTGSLGFHHARILRDVPGVAMAGIHDQRAERAAEVAGELGVDSHATLDALLDCADAIVIAVPTSAHEEVAIAALARGVHTLIEKPMAPTLEAADRILEAAERSGAVVQIGHVERFNAAIRAAEPWLDRPLFVESHRLAPFSARSTDVAVVLDLMIHDVDLVRSLVGTSVTEIAASGVAVLTPSIDIASARLTFEGGAVANLTASRVSVERMRKLRIFQPSGYLSLNLADGTGEFLRLKRGLPALGGDGAEQARAWAGGLADLVERVPLQGDGAEPLRKELESFRDAVLGDRSPVVSGRDGRDALALTLSIEARIASHVPDPRST